MSDIERKKIRKISDGVKRKKRTSLRERSTFTESAPERNFSQKSRVPKRRVASIRKPKQKERRQIQKELSDTPDASLKSTRVHKSTSRKGFFTPRRILFLKWGMFIALYGFLLFMIFSFFDHTYVSVEPKRKFIKQEELVTAYAHPNYKQLGFNIVAVSDTRSRDLEPETNKEVRQKASGMIKIFNNYSSEPQRLAPRTRFKSVSGKIFLLGEKGLVIPGKTASSAGVVEAKVYAEKAGADYNLDITDFTIPGFKEMKLTQKYNNIYALSTEKFKGGFIGYKKVVGEAEKKRALARIQAELEDLLYKRLDAEKTNKVILVENSPTLVFEEPVLKELDSEKVKISQKGKIFALLVEKRQLERYLRTIYTPKAHKDDNKLASFENISFALKKGTKINFSQLKKINFDMKINTHFVWVIDDLLIRSLRGLNKDDARTILREFEGIQKARIQIRPFWQSYISKNVKDISLEIK